MAFSRRALARMKERGRRGGLLSQRVQAEKRMARAQAAEFCGAVRLCGPMFGGQVLQLRLLTDGISVWHETARGVGRARTPETFFRAMNRRLWKAVGRQRHAMAKAAAVLLIGAFASCVGPSTAQPMVARGVAVGVPVAPPWPVLAWEGATDQLFQVERAEFSAADQYVPVSDWMAIVGPGSSMTWRSVGPGLYRVRTKAGRQE